MIFVANFYRPLTKTPQEAIEVMREIEDACKIKFTAIINNSNLGNLTTAKDVNATLDKAQELSDLTGLPIIYTTAVKGVSKGVNAQNVFEITLQEKIFDIKEN